MSIPFFGKVVSREGIQPDLQKVRALTKMPVPKELKGAAGLLRHN